jgi:hypothetical protein
MLGKGVLALAVAGAAGFLLFKDMGTPVPTPAVARAKPPVLTLDRPLGGTLYFAALGTGTEDESVYRLGPGDRRPVRLLPDNPRTWHVSAWDDQVVLNTDAGEWPAPAAAVTLAGAKVAGDAHTPTVGPRGRMAYLGSVHGGKVSAAFVRWGARDRFRPIAREGIWSTDFLPDGRLVVVQRRDARAWIMVLGEHGLEHEWRTPGNPQYELMVTRGGLIGYEGGTGTLRVYTPSGRRRSALDVEGWAPAGTRGRDFLLVEKDGERIASLSASGDLEVLGRHDPGYEISSLEGEMR